MRLVWVLAAALRAERLEWTTTVEGHIVLQPRYAGSFDGATAMVSLNGNDFVAIPAQDGYFAFRKVPPGEYLLQVSHADLDFDNVLLEVTERGGNSVSAFHIDRAYGRGLPLKYPLQLSPQGVYRFIERPVSTANSLMQAAAQRPMMMMMPVMVGFMFLVQTLAPTEEKTPPKTATKAVAGGKK
jgi:hypothetical protein